METIAGAPNTETPAYLILLGLGFDVICERDKDGHETWIALRHDFKFVGESPLQLLGLYCLRQHRGADWKASDQEIDEFLTRFYAENNG